MKLVSITLLRNEEDIVEAFVRYHCSFLDQMVLIDHGSTDATKEILEKLREEGLPITIQHEKRYGHVQAQVLTEALHDAVIRYDADWILPLDADEFIQGTEVLDNLPQDRIQKIIPKLYVPRPSDAKNERNIFARITHRRSVESEHSAVVLIPKFFALQKEVTIAPGNHDVFFKGKSLPSVVNSSLSVAHFPYRSPEQTEQKILAGYPRNLAQFGEDSSIAFHWKKIFEDLLDGKRLQYESLMELALNYPCIGFEDREQTLINDPFIFPKEIARKIEWKDVDVTRSLSHASAELLEGARNIHMLTAENAKQDAELREMRKHFSAVLDSKSWQWTAPIRQMEKFLKNRYSKPKITKRVTIVLPVFNAFEDVQKCIQSVLLHTDVSSNHLLIIDDASTDPRIGELLANTAKRYPHFVSIHRNMKNMGFVQSANIGLQFFQQDDVILLNSDCIVGPQWAALLRETAKKKGDAASVTALSNNASIYSVLRDTLGESPSLSDVSLVASEVKRVSPRSIPRIPTGVGFCLYMERSAIEDTGYFDEVFGMGYGEENDWCMRATKKGWKHYLDDRCFVYHKGSSSMKAAGHVQEGSSTIEAHENILQKKHPDYTRRVRQFLLNAKRMGRIQGKLFDVGNVLSRKKSKIIGFVLHAPLDSKHAGGTELHVKSLIKNLHYESPCFAIVIQPNALEITLYEKRAKTHFTIPFPAQGNVEAFRLFFEVFRIDILHVHHTLGSSFEMLPLAKAYGARVVYTIHDSYSYCMEPQPLWHTDAGKHMVRPLGERKKIAEDLAVCDRIIAPSKSALELFLEYYPECPAQCSVIPHGLAATSMTSRKPTRHSVCFLGRAQAPQKGRDLVEHVAHILRKKGVRVYFVGSSWRAWAHLAFRKNIKCFGGYRPQEITNLLYTLRPSVVCLFSLFPETYSYTLSEAWAAGIPTYVTPIGALEERTRLTQAGQIAPSFTAKEIADDLLRYLSSTEIDEHRKNSWKVFIPTDAEMAKEYQKIYTSLFVKPQTIKQREPARKPSLTRR